MKTVILGAGVVGVATAYYLAREGHEVLVIERQPGVARETSFANAGLVAPGIPTPGRRRRRPGSCSNRCSSRARPCAGNCAWIRQSYPHTFNFFPISPPHP